MLSKYGCTCSALVVETFQVGPEITSPAIISFGLIQCLSFDEILVLIVGGFLGRIPPRFLYTCWLVGALTLTQDTFLQTVIAFLAITFASINVFGGYLVTNRMLSMFKKK